LSNKHAAIGIDVGGTNVKFGLLDPQGRIIGRGHLATDPYKSSRKRLIHAIAQKIRGLCRDHAISFKEIKGVGMGLPGLIDFHAGVVAMLPNIPGWKNVPLRKLLEADLKVPVFLDNDVNVIALGEWKYGAGRGYDDLIEITLGTGVGGGLILDGKLYRGCGFAAGEIGHIPVDEKGPLCGCGQRGCLETFIGNRAISAKVSKIFKRNMQPHDVYALAVKKDPRALKFWKDFGIFLGRSLVGLVNALNPRAIIFGGGVSNNFPFFKKSLEHVLKTRCMTVQAKNVKILRGALGDDAGLIGAHVLVEESLRGK